MQQDQTNPFDTYNTSSPSVVEAVNPFDQCESETLLHHPTAACQPSMEIASHQPIYIGSSSAHHASEEEPITIGPHQDSFRDDCDDDYDTADQSQSSLISSNGNLKYPEKYDDRVPTAITKNQELNFDDDDSDNKCSASASTEKAQKNKSKGKGKTKLTEEERRIRLNAYEENKKKYRTGKFEMCILATLAIGVITAVIVVIVMQDQIWPPPVETFYPTLSPTSVPTLAPTSARPSNQPSLSMVPTYMGYRDKVILENLITITPSLPKKGADLDDSTPQFKAAKFIIYDDPLLVKPYMKDQILQRYALVTLYYATNGENWNTNSLWLSKESICMWHGLTCSNSFDDTDDSPHLTKAILQENNMKGEIPSEVKALSNLTDVSLEKNRLSGGIFDIFIGMDELKSLDLRNNEFDGEIAPNIKSMSRLQLLYLEGNKFSGTIPAALGKSKTLSKFKCIIFALVVPNTQHILYYQKAAITMHRNNLTGTMPDEICEVINDYTADCYNNYPINCTCCSDSFNQCY